MIARQQPGPGGERDRREPAWDEKVLLLEDALAAERLSHAFGGAIALNYHREPRATLDIDINIFVSPEHEDRVLDVLGATYELADRAGTREELARDGQARTVWGDTYIDLFLANTAFHESMARRIERQPFGEKEIPVLSIEDLLVCKALFDRPKDWLDLEAVIQARGRQIERSYIISWLRRFIELSDPRLQRVQALLEAGQQEPAGSG